MNEPLTAASQQTTSNVAEQAGAVFVVRRVAQRRNAQGAEFDDSGFDDRRLGLGRRLDDWRRKPQAAEIPEPAETCG